MTILVNLVLCFAAVLVASGNKLADEERAASLIQNCNGFPRELSSGCNGDKKLCNSEIKRTIDLFKYKT